MKTIWKYPISNAANQLVMMPAGAEALTVQLLVDGPYVWAMVDTDAPLEPRMICVYGTGYPVDGDDRYIGTYYTDGGGQIFHVFDAGPRLR